MNPESVKRFIAEVIKADLWEVLAIIGMTQILLIPSSPRAFVCGWRR